MAALPFASGPARAGVVDQVHTLTVVELWVATAVIGYVCLRFVRYAWAHWSEAHGALADDY